MDLQSVSNGIRIQKVTNKTQLSYYYIVSLFRSGYRENIKSNMVKPYAVIHTRSTNNSRTHVPAGKSNLTFVNEPNTNAFD